ncbi:MAG TPA: hypothetical protein VHX88_19090 [Solirubrobacteraceae bacterium]|jgi:hypothetical protein|nr:hypothetical protein [Solirubrobacteraceae bacterium]
MSSSSTIARPGDKASSTTGTARDQPNPAGEEQPSRLSDSSPVALAPTERRPIATYVDVEGIERSMHVLAGAGGSVLLIDRARDDGSDARLVAHLWPDEPLSNIRLLTRMYLADLAAVRCRPLEDEDLRRDPGAPTPSIVAQRTCELGEPGAVAGELADRRGRLFRLEAVPLDQGDARELRWTRTRDDADGGEVVRLRDVVGALEDYEPARSISLAQVDCRGCERRGISRGRLRIELERLGASPIVLNRRLRETVVAMVAAGGLSMSEVAIRCGRVKRDPRGRVSGETSWLGRRLGLLPECGTNLPSPWVHSEVLALIARRGLGIPPRDVEL